MVEQVQPSKTKEYEDREEMTKLQDVSEEGYKMVNLH